MDGILTYSLIICNITNILRKIEKDGDTYVVMSKTKLKYEMNEIRGKMLNIGEARMNSKSTDTLIDYCKLSGEYYCLRKIIGGMYDK